MKIIITIKLVKSNKQCDLLLCNGCTQLNTKHTTLCNKIQWSYKSTICVLL